MKQKQVEPHLFCSNTLTLQLMARDGACPGQNLDYTSFCSTFNAQVSEV